MLTFFLILTAGFGCKEAPGKLPVIRAANQPEDGIIDIQLGNTISANGLGIAVNGTKITIFSAGTYRLSGTLAEGQVVVNTGDQGTVNLILNGADINSSKSVPIRILKAAKTVVTLVEGTENFVSDGNPDFSNAALKYGPDAVIFSQSDLLINGKGMLTVNAQNHHGLGIQGKLSITGGHININSANDGIRTQDSITVLDSNITINAGSDGLQSNSDENPAMGNVSIENGTLNIVSGRDAIQSQSSLNLSGVDITISSGGGSNSLRSGSSKITWDRWAVGSRPDSAKGLKAGTINITGGTLNIDSADDAINSNDLITINNSKITISAGDDGLHADSGITINSGDIDLKQCYEGIESAAVTINDGRIRVISRDDGINVAGDYDGSSLDGQPGQNNFSPSGRKSLNINGGYIFVDAAGGDGLDINGVITMTGGTVIINGPINDNNAALDYDKAFKLTGGFLVAAGSSGMAQAPDPSSTQNSVMLNFISTQPANTLLHIKDQDSTAILTFVPVRAYQSVVLSSPTLKNGNTYVAYTGGVTTGTEADGLYSGGTYTGGEEFTTFTISSPVTIFGPYGSHFPRGWNNGIIP